VCESNQEGSETRCVYATKWEAQTGVSEGAKVDCSHFGTDHAVNRCGDGREGGWSIGRELCAVESIDGGEPCNNNMWKKPHLFFGRQCVPAPAGEPRRSLELR
jgi:hypothetical protein